MTVDWLKLLTAVATALGVAMLLFIAFGLTTYFVGRRRPPVADFRRRAKVPFRILVVIVAVNPVIEILRPSDSGSRWWEVGAVTARILTIVAIGWLATTIVLFFVDAGLRRYRVEGTDNRRVRQIRTQTTIIRRLIVTVAIVLVVGAVLVTLPNARALGTSVLASAGLVSVVAALAAQTVLGNVFAGIQIAFNDALRLDDVVVIDEQQGRVTELTLTYVVVLLWDERCMVLPCTYFTTNHFLNLTRNSAKILGTVELDLDWNVDVDALRSEFERMLDGDDRWDRRSSGLVVTAATNGCIRVRAAMTAADVSTLWNLRAHVREHLVRWLRQHGHAGLPRQRFEVVAGDVPPVAPRAIEQPPLPVD